MSRLKSGLTAGYESLSAWSDLLDRINVFPVADSDTGTNLRVSLAPFRRQKSDPETMRKLLGQCATGNSGNIAVAFFRELCHAEHLEELGKWVVCGRDKAYKAVADPQRGTMLSFFDILAKTLQSRKVENAAYHHLMDDLQRVVDETTRELPDLDRAGVVDSGALAMYIFFDGFLKHCTCYNQPTPSVVDLFAGKLVIKDSYTAPPSSEHCIDAVIRTDMDEGEIEQKIAALGKSIVIIPAETGLKVHVHSSEPQQLRSGLQALGEVTRWSDEKITQAPKPQQLGESISTIRIVTDAAGSITRDTADRFGITLLDSYIVAGDEAKPESLCCPEHIYSLLKRGIKVTTAQASTYERCRHYESVCRQFGASLYLCVGSAFTGNYDAASDWKKNNDPQGQFTIIDSGAASGRLGLIALLTAKLAQKGILADRVTAFARKMMAECVEYVFIDELKYLVAGGRVSRAKGFFGDLMRMKPVVSPTAEGVRKVGIARNRGGQLSFALEKLAEQVPDRGEPVILLQYSDNEEWVRDTVEGTIRDVVPGADILRMPLSLTSGVHMGPGTWSLAFVPDSGTDQDDQSA